MTIGDESCFPHKIPVIGPDDLFPGGTKEIGTRIFMGLTKRELFAALAMQGLIATGIDGKEYFRVAEDSVNAADALLEALEKK